MKATEKNTLHIWRKPVIYVACSQTRYIYEENQEHDATKIESWHASLDPHFFLSFFLSVLGGNSITSAHHPLSSVVNKNVPGCWKKLIKRKLLMVDNKTRYTHYIRSGSILRFACSGSQVLTTKSPLLSRNVAPKGMVPSHPGRKGTRVPWCPPSSAYHDREAYHDCEMTCSSGNAPSGGALDDPLVADYRPAHEMDSYLNHTCTQETRYSMGKRWVGALQHLGEPSRLIHHCDIVNLGKAQGQRHLKGRSTVPHSGEVPKHHPHIFRKTGTACTLSKTGMVAYLSGGQTLHVETVIILL